MVWDNAGTNVTGQISEPHSPKENSTSIYTFKAVRSPNITLHLGEETCNIHLNLEIACETKASPPFQSNLHDKRWNRRPPVLGRATPTTELHSPHQPPPTEPGRRRRSPGLHPLPPGSLPDFPWRVPGAAATSSLEPPSTARPRGSRRRRGSPGRPFPFLRSFPFSSPFPSAGAAGTNLDQGPRAPSGRAERGLDPAPSPSPRHRPRRPALTCRPRRPARSPRSASARPKYRRPPGRALLRRRRASRSAPLPPSRGRGCSAGWDTRPGPRDAPTPP